jgi:hypothetical protein
MRAFCIVATAVGSIVAMCPSYPGYALDVSVAVGGASSASGGANVGTLSAGGDVTAGGGGVSADVGVDSGGVSAGGNISARGGGVSASSGVSVGDDRVSAGGNINAGGVSVGEEAAEAVPAAGAPNSTGLGLAISLPQPLLPGCVLSPEGCGGDDDGMQPTLPADEMVGALLGASLPEAFMVCRDHIVREAAQFGALNVDVLSAGPVRERGSGGQIAPLTVRIIYPGEVKQAPVDCYLDANWAVVAVQDA